ncbi:sugar porter family MFS transporter, partial [bacterium LRH843]|nr:sugar porter family MFS transporter [bacterium LRH843]
PVLISWCIILSVKSAYTFYIARLLQGYAVSVVFTVCPMYLSEIASVEARGRITALVQVMWYLGILLQFCTGSYLSYEVNAYTN